MSLFLVSIMFFFVFIFCLFIRIIIIVIIVNIIVVVLLYEYNSIFNKFKSAFLLVVEAKWTENQLRKGMETVLATAL